MPVEGSLHCCKIWLILTRLGISYKFKFSDCSYAQHVYPEARELGVHNKDFTTGGMTLFLTLDSLLPNARVMFKVG